MISFHPELLPFITDLCNCSLLQGSLSFSQHHMTVTASKKTNKDHSVAKNYRPISNLTFLSKTVEKLVCCLFSVFISFLEKNELLPNLQSAYRKNHSIELQFCKLYQIFWAHLIEAMLHFYVFSICELCLYTYPSTRNGICSLRNGYIMDRVIHTSLITYNQFW